MSHTVMQLHNFEAHKYMFLILMEVVAVDLKNNFGQGCWSKNERRDERRMTKSQTHVQLYRSYLSHFYPWRACAALPHFNSRRTWVYHSRFVCLCVCWRLFWHHRLRGGPWAIPTASELHVPEKQNGVFLKWLHLWGIPWEQAKKPICKFALGLPQPDPLAPCTLEAQEVTTKGGYRLPHGLY
jgi:hypothetical protein